MPDVNTKPKHDTTEGDHGAVPSAERTTRDTTRPQIRVIPLLITLATIALAVPLGWATWDAYMGAPWTRDGTVRAYVVTMAPEVAGRIIKLPVADNQFVHKGDELFEIDPAD
jgi:multidrug resistance efflux pump